MTRRQIMVQCRECSADVCLETRAGAVILGQRCSECGERVDAGKVSRRSFFGIAFGAVAAVAGAGSVADSIGPDSFRNGIVFGPEHRDILDILSEHLEAIRPKLAEIYNSNPYGWRNTADWAREGLTRGLYRIPVVGPAEGE